MNEKNAKANRRNSILLILLVVGVVLAGLLLTFVMFWLDILPVPAFLQDLLHLSDSEHSNSSDVSGDIPEILPDSDELRDLFYDVDPSDLLGVLRERSSYVRVIRVIHSYGGDHVIRHYTITKRDNFWRADTESGKWMWNGRELYLEDGENVYRSDSGDFNFFEEIGITPLNQIRHAADEKGCRYALSDNGKILNITIMDEENEIRSEYEISVESGVVISETSYYQDTAFRTVLTDSIDYFGTDSLPEEFFTIPSF